MVRNADPPASSSATNHILGLTNVNINTIYFS
jgi:hypothetical protein